MEVDFFKIYVDRLRHGETENLSFIEPCAFLDVSEPDLSYTGDVQCEGEAYVVDEELILHLRLQAQAAIPCKICNKGVEVKIEIPEFYHAEPLSEIKSGIFDFRTIVRETIILDTPHYAECNEGSCPERKRFKKYLKSAKEPSSGGEDHESYRPFEDL